MSRPAIRVSLTPDEYAGLEQLLRSSTTEHRLVFRARIVLAAARNTPTQAIAQALKIRPATVSKWRARVALHGVQGLTDAPRPGALPTYDETTERRILAHLDAPPPHGYATWNGRLLAAALGDVSPHQVWRVLKRHGIQLQRRRSWCLSTDPAFAPKAADIVGLYLHPPENAVVLSVDEKPHIQALERAQGYLRLPNGRAITGYSHEYKRHGTTTLFAALNVATGQVTTGHTHRRRRKEFLAFMNQIVREHPGREIHVILDNLNIHKPKHDRWLARHKRVRLHYTPTHASWLNQVETWFSILARGALKGTSFTSPQQVREAIDRFVQAYNPVATPFAWTTPVVYQARPKRYYADLRK